MNEHGKIIVKETHFSYEDGTRFYPFGTTIYALAYQNKELIEETFATLEKSPFNKVRMCVFPKYYDYNREEPQWKIGSVSQNLYINRMHMDIG